MLLCHSKLHCLSIFIVLVFSCEFLFAQQVIQADSVDYLEIPIEQISISDGLSQGMINAVVEDGSGYLWIATKDGLNRYDGVDFKVFRHNPDDPNSVAENFIGSLYVDSHNRLWVGTQSKGVDLFDPLTERFHHFRHDSADSSTLSSDIIGVILEDPKGNVIVETLDSIGFNLMTEITQTNKETRPEFRIEPLSNLYPSMIGAKGDGSWNKNIAFDSFGTLWFYNGIHIIQINPDSPEPLLHPQPTTHQKAVNDENTLIFDPNKEVLYTTDHHHVIKKFDWEKQEFVPFIELPKKYSVWKSPFIDDENTMWIWQPNFTVLRIDLANGDLTVINPHWSKLERMARNHTSISLQDKQGNYWMGTGGNGLLKINSRFNQFRKIPDQQATISGSIRLFRTVKSHNRAYLDKELLNTWPAIEEKLNLVSKKLSLSAANSHLVLDDNGIFWTGGYHLVDKMEYLLRINAKTNSVTKISEHSIDGNEWYAMPVFLGHYNNVWFGEKYYRNTSRLFKYNQQTAQLDTFTFPVEVNKMQYRFISDWYQEPNDVFWFATTHGVFSFNPNKEKWQTFRFEDGNPLSLSSNITLCVCPDPIKPDSIMWIGTEGGGLNRLDRITGKIKRFNTKDGLPNDVIYAIQPDAHKNLWISTNQGLCLFNPTNFKTRTFTTFDGLPGNEFNRYEYSSTDDGILCFGGTSGVVYFNPEDFYHNSNPSKVVINRLSLFNNPVRFSYSSEKPDIEKYTLPAPVEYCNKLVFNHNHDMITLGFSTLDLTTPEQNRFKYKLEGLNDDWIEAGTDNHATYTDLSPGNYTFKVLGSNSANVWSINPTTVAITVLPPWWGTWWFRSLMALLVGGLLYSFYRYRLGQFLKMERMRNRIAQDLHDEIGSTLSSISLYSTVLQTTVKNLPENAHGILNKISDSTSEMMESMNDMVWAIKADNDSFEQVVDRMRAFSVNMTEAKKVKLIFDADQHALQLKPNMNQRKNVYLIYKEAVNNAIKYSEANTLSVNISSTFSQLKIVIKDNGKGFDPAAAQTSNQMGGNGLKGMHVRAKELNAVLTIDSIINQGTEVRLSVPI